MNRKLFTSFIWLILLWTPTGHGETTPSAVIETSPSAASTHSKSGTPHISATATVERLNQALLQAMRRGKELDYEGRYRLLEPVIREVYDFQAVSRHVLGPFWKRLSPAQRKSFIEKMTRYGIATYASQFADYEGERFTIVTEKTFRERFRVVKSILEVPGNNEDVVFDYILRRTRDGWKIIDVRYDGISDLALKRGQFSEILEKEGFEALLSKLEKKIADYASESQVDSG